MAERGTPQRPDKNIPHDGIFDADTSSLVRKSPDVISYPLGSLPSNVISISSRRPAHHRPHRSGSHASRDNLRYFRESKRKTLEERWHSLTPREKAGAVTLGVAALGASLFGIYEAVHTFGEWQMRNVKSERNDVINVDDPAFPSYESVVTTTSEPSVSVTSTPPGRKPLNIKVPKK